MKFEWDESKRRSNQEKHDVDFADVKQLFDGRPVRFAESTYPFEMRFLTTGILNDRLITVIWTSRGGGIRLISARRARDGEERAYRELHSGRT